MTGKSPKTDLLGSTRREQSVTADWEFVRDLIDGVQVREVRNVPKRDGVLVEVWRRDWGLDNLDTDQLFQVTLQPGAISGWHAHRETTDRLFANDGMLKIVLYDARVGSPTHGQINELRYGSLRPALVVVPPGVWHAVQNVHHAESRVLNLVDRAYSYEAPDHWSLPIDTEQIPYRFESP